jgi:hypothetical protein
MAAPAGKTSNANAESAGASYRQNAQALDVGDLDWRLHRAWRGRG